MFGLVASSSHGSSEGRQGVRELCSGIDALYLSGRAELSPALFETLEVFRKAAEENDQPVPLPLDGVEFFVHRRALGKYRYRISHERGLIGFTPSENLPAIRVQPRAEFLHGVGPVAALEFFGSVGEFLAGGPATWTLSRLDLFSDVQGWDLHGDERHRFICRAERRDLHEHGAGFGGFEFGRRTTKTVCARIYDKTRKMSIESNGQGQHHYRCKHRGEGCNLSGRSNQGLLAAVVLALELLCDEELRDAIRKHLDVRRQPYPVRRRRTNRGTKALEALHTKRNKLLGLYYEEKITSDQFGEEQARLTTEIENLIFDSEASAAELAKVDDVAVHFEQLVEVLDKLNLSEVWDHATEQEKRTIVDEMLDNVTIRNDWLVVNLHGAPALNVAFSEVGPKDSVETCRRGP